MEQVLICNSESLYGISFSNSPYHPYRTALTSLVSSATNKLSIIDLTQDVSSPHLNSIFQPLASASHAYPPTKVGWEPKKSMGDTGGEGSRGELLATTGDVLRIWDLVETSDNASGGGYVGRNGWGEDGQGQTRHSLRERSVLTNVSRHLVSLLELT